MIVLACHSEVTYYAGPDSDYADYYICQHGDVYEIGALLNGENWSKDQTVFATKKGENTFVIGAVLRQDGVLITNTAEMEEEIAEFSKYVAGQFEEELVEVTEEDKYTLDARKILRIHFPGCQITYDPIDYNNIPELASDYNNARKRYFSIH